MREAVVIMIVISVLLILTAIRYRRQLQTMLGIWKMFRKMREMNRQKEIPNKENLSDVPLVKCARCRTWISEANAINLGSNTFYCSASCVERSVEMN